MAKTEKASEEFAKYVVDCVSRLGPVTSRAMFGGRNLALEGITFGIIAYDVLYLKVDDVNRPLFDKAGLGPFVYGMKDGKPMSMAYHAAPDCLDDWAELKPWVTGALDAARRAKKPVAKKPVAKKPVAKKLAGKR
jgi:DNA transformation protein and related proteins